MKRITPFLLFFVLLSACHSHQTLSGIGYKGYPVGQTKKSDTSYLSMLKPYRDSVDKTMNEVLAQNATDLLKEVPNSRLGNFLADAYLWAAREKFDKRADVAPTILHMLGVVQPLEMTGKSLIL